MNGARKIQSVRAKHHKGREISLAVTPMRLDRPVRMATPRRPPLPPQKRTKSWWIRAPRWKFQASAEQRCAPESMSTGARMALSPWPMQREE